MTCGTCTLCCKLLGVDEVESKAGEWCRHCDRAGGGCRIYEKRPDPCRTFECVWLQSQTMATPLAPALRPDRCRVVLTPTTDGAGLVAHVDPDRPDAYQRAPVAPLLHRAMVHTDKRVIVVIGDKRKMLIEGEP